MIKRRPKPKTIQERACAARLEANLRAHARRGLALRIGNAVLNEVEYGGQCYINDYNRVVPGWVLALYRESMPRHKRRSKVVHSRRSK